MECSYRTKDKTESMKKRFRGLGKLELEDHELKALKLQISKISGPITFKLFSSSVQCTKEESDMYRRFDVMLAQVYIVLEQELGRRIHIRQSVKFWAGVAFIIGQLLYVWMYIMKLRKS
jgi:hypothetical protein